MVPERFYSLYRIFTRAAAASLLSVFAVVIFLSQVDPPTSPLEDKYPVVLLRAGLSVMTADYSQIAEDLASHGYVVAGVDAPYRTSVVVLRSGSIIERASQNNADLLNGEQQRFWTTASRRKPRQPRRQDTLDLHFKDYVDRCKRYLLSASHHRIRS
jgi:hypothetical protein